MATETFFVFAKILEAIGPLDRGDKYEDPLQEILDAQNLGEVTGGGTLQGKDGKILNVGIDIELFDLQKGLPVVARVLAELGAPVGSTLEYDLNGKRTSLSIGSPATT